MKGHPIANVFPMMTYEEHQTLLCSMRDIGYDRSKPVVVYQDLILDGRNRYKAATELGLEVPIRRWTDGDGNPWEFVRRENTSRRELEQSTKAACVLKLVRGSDAWEAEGERRRESANKARSEAAKAQHSVSNPRAGERSGHVSRDTRPKVSEEHERVRLARLSGTSVATSGRVLALASAAPEQFERVVRGEVSAPKALGELKLANKRALAETIRANPIVTPDGRYQVIVSDPPWKYDTRAEDTSHRGKNQYPDMTTEEICALPVGNLAQSDCVLWLWTTNAFMRDAYRCLDAWGFREKTILTWDKELLGLGDWLRNVTEHCVLAVRGKPVVSLTNQTTIIREKRREHSRKPEAFYSLVEALCPGSKLEMFSRSLRDGWAGWGAETEKFDAVG